MLAHSGISVYIPPFHKERHICGLSASDSSFESVRGRATHRRLIRFTSERVGCAHRTCVWCIGLPSLCALMQVPPPCSCGSVAFCWITVTAGLRIQNDQTGTIDTTLKRTYTATVCAVKDGSACTSSSVYSIQEAGPSRSSPASSR